MADEGGVRRRRRRSIWAAAVVVALVLIGSLAALPVIGSGTLRPERQVTFDRVEGGLLSSRLDVVGRRVLQTRSGRYLVVRNGPQLTLVDIDRDRVLLQVKTDGSATVRLDSDGRYAFVVERRSRESWTTAYPIEGGDSLWAHHGEALAADGDLVVTGAVEGNQGRQSPPQGRDIRTGKSRWTSSAPLGELITDEPLQDDESMDHRPSEDSSVLPNVAVVRQPDHYQLVRPSDGTPLGEPMPYSDRVHWWFRKTPTSVLAFQHSHGISDPPKGEVRIHDDDGSFQRSRTLPGRDELWSVAGDRLVGKLSVSTYVSSPIDGTEWVEVVDPEQSIEQAQFTSEVMVTRSAADTVTATRLTDGRTAWTHRMELPSGRGATRPAELTFRADGDTVIVAADDAGNLRQGSSERAEVLDGSTGRRTASIVHDRNDNAFLVGVGHGDARFGRLVGEDRVRIQSPGRLTLPWAD